jgi:PAS domain S-box-containing protein
MWAKIVLNLLSNALKFTFSGSITVRVQRGEGGARLSVTDTGIGIAPGDQARLFERFHRIVGARGRTHEGSGIGLALVAELASLHGGRTELESTSGQGSTFSVEVPFGHEHLPGDQLSQGREVSLEREIAGFLAEASRWLRPDAEDDRGRAASAPSERPSILVVDDNADMRDYIATLLADDYSVQTAPDGLSALELATADPPDLILTDVMMPRLDGFGLLEALQSNPETLHVPVVMVSARAGEEGVIEGLEAGADDYLVKPFSARELRARVRANLELDRARKTQEQLERSRRIQDQAERLAEVGSWEVDLRRGTLSGSEQLVRMFGLTATQYSSMSYDDALAQLVHPDHRESVRRILDHAISTREPFEYERRLLGDGADERWIRVRGEVIEDDQGQPARLTGYIQDITRHKQAEEAVAAAAAAREAAAREHRIADELQRSLLPADGFASDHLQVATYYQAGVAGTRVGGDWYDAIDLGAGRTALMIGDVSGRGIAAARIMGQLRAATRAYARLDLPPADMIEMLDAMVRELAADQLVTCIYGIYDPATHEFRYANAGHLPPLAVAPGEPARRLAIATDPPLGVGLRHAEEHQVSFPAGTLIALYTDGLVERRGRSLDDGIDLLAETLSSDTRHAAQLPDALIRKLAPDGTEDDVAILVARTDDSVSQRTAVLEVPRSSQGLQAGRRFTTEMLERWSLPPRTAQDATLITSELLTNAIMHGSDPVRLRLRVTREELAIEVYDGASALPRKLKTTADDLHGRGLAIIAELSERWAARPEGHGKVVWCALPIAPVPDAP